MVRECRDSELWSRPVAQTTGIVVRCFLWSFLHNSDSFQSFLYQTIGILYHFYFRQVFVANIERIYVRGKGLGIQTFTTTCPTKHFGIQKYLCKRKTEGNKFDIKSLSVWYQKRYRVEALEDSHLIFYHQRTGGWEGLNKSTNPMHTLSHPIQRMKLTYKLTPAHLFVTFPVQKTLAFTLKSNPTPDIVRIRSFCCSMDSVLFRLFE